MMKGLGASSRLWELVDKQPSVPLEGRCSRLEELVYKQPTVPVEGRCFRQLGTS